MDGLPAAAVDLALWIEYSQFHLILSAAAALYIEACLPMGLSKFLITSQTKLLIT